MATKPAQPLHLTNAARTLERILARRNPEHIYTVNIGPVKANDASTVPGFTGRASEEAVAASLRRES